MASETPETALAVTSTTACCGRRSGDCGPLPDDIICKLGVTSRVQVATPNGAGSATPEELEAVSLLH